MPDISINFFVFQLEISGKDFNDSQFLNILDIYLTLFVFNFEISGNDFIDLQKEKYQTF